MLHSWRNPKRKLLSNPKKASDAIPKHFLETLLIPRYPQQTPEIIDGELQEEPLGEIAAESLEKFCGRIRVKITQEITKPKTLQKFLKEPRE